MAKFKVKVLQLLLKGNKIAKSGEEVDESQLLTNAKDLEKDKFIERVDTKAKKKSEEEAAKKKAEEEAAKKKTEEEAKKKAEEEAAAKKSKTESKK